MASARYHFIEGSVFGLRRAKGSVKSKENVSEIKGKSGFRRAEGSVKLKECVSTIESFQVVLFIDNHRNQKNH